MKKPQYDPDPLLRKGHGHKHARDYHRDNKVEVIDICPHCYSDAGTWFDRSMECDMDGNEREFETFPTRCIDCGKNVDAPRSYYRE